MWQSVATKHFWSNTRPQVGTHGCNARACGKHNDVGLRVLWQQHLCTGGACDEHLVSWCHVLGCSRVACTNRFVQMGLAMSCNVLQCLAMSCNVLQCLHNALQIYIIMQPNAELLSHSGPSRLSFADVVGANSAVDLVVWESGACLVRLVLSLCSVAELAIQLHHSLHACQWLPVSWVSNTTE